MEQGARRLRAGPSSFRATMQLTDAAAMARDHKLRDVLETMMKRARQYMQQIQERLDVRN